MLMRLPDIFVLKVLVVLLLSGPVLHAQVDSTETFPEFDSQLLRLKVPDAFQKSSLKLEIFSDSSWQLYRGSYAFSFTAALEFLGQDEKLVQYEAHLEKHAELPKGYRSRRVFSMVTGLGGVSYLIFSWSQSWVYHIPGYVAILVAGQRLWESRKIEIQAQRETYYLSTLISPSQVKSQVDEYNFRLYQYLSKAGIQFSDS
ncbi:MAG: hypothetical protein L3J79_08240 [Candidatus Marinimicrobia bacterium]|nr:hypothetical protein [Candidatus Neomarinimicrobiota bacterium]